MWRRAVALTVLATLPLGALVIWAANRPAATVVRPAGPGSPETGEVAIRAYTWGFSPAIVRVTPRDTVRFTVGSDDIRHGFAINELGVNLQLVPGQERRSSSVGVSLPPGRYTIHCSVFCGLGHPSMKATLLVGDPGPTLGQALPWIASLVGLGAVVAVALRARAGHGEDTA